MSSNAYNIHEHEYLSICLGFLSGPAVNGQRYFLHAQHLKCRVQSSRDLFFLVLCGIYYICIIYRCSAIDPHQAKRFPLPSAVGVTLCPLLPIARHVSDHKKLEAHTIDRFILLTPASPHTSVLQPSTRLLLVGNGQVFETSRAPSLSEARSPSSCRESRHFQLQRVSCFGSHVSCWDVILTPLPSSLILSIVVLHGLPPLDMPRLSRTVRWAPRQPL